MLVVTDGPRKIHFQIDNADYEAVSYYSWYIAGSGYPYTAIGLDVLARATTNLIPLHVFLLGRAPGGLVWDHINRDKLDNRRSNLRAVTQSVNSANKDLSAKSVSGANGVSWDRKLETWQVHVYPKGKPTFVGNFKSLDAAKTARLVAERFQGELSRWRTREDVKRFREKVISVMSQEHTDVA